MRGFTILLGFIYRLDRRRLRTRSSSPGIRANKGMRLCAVSLCKLVAVCYKYKQSRE